MASTKSDQNPDKRDRSKPKDYLSDWIKRQSLVENMIPMIGNLHRKQNVRILLYGNPLITLSVSQIMQEHRLVRETEKNELSEFETFEVINILKDLDLGPCEIDVGIISAGHMFDSKSLSLEEFVKEQVADAIGNKNPVLQKPQDLVLFGFGRIGRLITRLLLEDTGSGETLSLKAVVVRKKSDDDLFKRAELMRRDSVHGNFKGTIRVDLDEYGLVINGNLIKFIDGDPSSIDYKKYGIDNAVIIDNSGVWRDEKGLSAHLKSKGANKVLLTAPTKSPLKNIVYGVNENDLDDKDKIVGAASCTTNAIVPLLKALDDDYGITNGHVETIHSYTNDQNLIDNFHSKSRRGRSAALNMVITETGAASAVSQILPNLKGKLTANAIRVPTPNVSLAILKLSLNKSLSDKETANEYFRQLAFHSIYKDQIDFTNSSEIVSSDLVGSRYACVIDSEATICDNKQVVIYAWYDNELGYCVQLLRVIKSLAGIKYNRLPYFL